MVSTGRQILNSHSPACPDPTHCLDLHQSTTCWADVWQSPATPTETFWVSNKPGDHQISGDCEQCRRQPVGSLFAVNTIGNELTLQITGYHRRGLENQTFLAEFDWCATEWTTARLQFQFYNRLVASFDRSFIVICTSATYHRAITTLKLMCSQHRDHCDKIMTNIPPAHTSTTTDD